MTAADDYPRRPRTMTSPNTVILVLDGLIAELRASGIIDISVDDLARSLGNVKRKLAEEAATVQQERRSDQ